MQNLSARQQRICELIASGFADKEIASELNLSEETIGKQLDFLYSYARLKKRTKASLTAWWMNAQKREEVRLQVLRILSAPDLHERVSGQR